MNSRVSQVYKAAVEERPPSPGTREKSFHKTTADRVLGVHGFGTPVMGISQLGSSPMCEIGTSGRSVYQMKNSREQALGEGNCVRVTERGKEACECMGTVIVEHRRVGHRTIE
jgi:hypothetical protein